MKTVVDGFTTGVRDFDESQVLKNSLSVNTVDSYFIEQHIVCN